MRKLLFFLLVSATVMGFLSCKDDPMSPFNPEIANNADNFQFQITGAKNLDHTEIYIWQNTSTRASINQSCAITGGTAAVTISDSTGAVLYTRNLADNGTFQSLEGIAGRWFIRVNFTNLDGTINFRVQKL